MGVVEFGAITAPSYTILGWRQGLGQEPQKKDTYFNAGALCGGRLGLNPRCSALNVNSQPLNIFNLCLSPLLLLCRHSCIGVGAHCRKLHRLSLSL